MLYTLRSPRVGRRLSRLSEAATAAGERLKLGRIERFISRAALLFCAIVLIFNAPFFFESAAPSARSFMWNLRNTPTAEQVQLATWLDRTYDGGRVLTSEADAAGIVAHSTVPLQASITEQSGPLFDTVLKEPWLFARYVIIEKKQPSAVSVKWAGSEQFLSHYNLMHENNSRQLYRVNETSVMKLGIERGYNYELIPSLNPASLRWDARQVYVDMVTGPSAVKNGRLARAGERIIMYESRLRPALAAGYIADDPAAHTAEAQAYAMQQAVFTDDRESFDTVWYWTQTNLQRPDGLFASQFSVENSVVRPSGGSTTGASTDIAYALTMAAVHWDEVSYVTEATTIAQALWDASIINVNGQLHLAAGDWAITDDRIVVNPSYYHPLAYELFNEIDPTHPWRELVQAAYQDIALSATGLPYRDQFALPSNWMVIDRASGAALPYEARPDSLDFGYEAYRVFWKVALDWYATERATAAILLETAAPYFLTKEGSRGVPCTIFVFQQQDPACYSDPTALAGASAVLQVTHPEQAAHLMNQAGILPRAGYIAESWHYFMLWMAEQEPQLPAPTNPLRSS
jgi:hypothetical protein